jgi:hypothetical protein
MREIKYSAVEFATTARQGNRGQPDALIHAVKEFANPHPFPVYRTT